MLGFPQGGAMAPTPPLSTNLVQPPWTDLIRSVSLPADESARSLLLLSVRARTSRGKEALQHLGGRQELPSRRIRVALAQGC